MTPRPRAHECARTATSPDAFDDPPALRTTRFLFGSGRAAARTLVVAGVLGVGLWLLPLDIEFGPFSLKHVQTCEAPTTVVHMPPPDVVR